MEQLQTDSVRKFNFSNTCRACLTECENLKSLLTELSETPTILEMFNKMCSEEVQIKEEDNLPSNLCLDCIEKLRMAYNFQNMCNSSYQVLQQYLHESLTNQVTTEIKIEDHEIPDDNTKRSSSEDSDSSTIIAVPMQNGNFLKKQKLRLKQFPHDEVMEAIENTRKRFMENVECIKCQFVGSNSRNLAVHMAHIHKELKDKWCSYCNAVVENLQAHSLAHENNELKCCFCEKRCGCRGHLIEHLRSHSKDRPFKCTICVRTFISARHLNVHNKIHSNASAFECPYCKKTYTHMQSLKTHLKQQHDEELKNASMDNEDIDSLLGVQNVCNICEKKVRNLSEHLQKYHIDNSLKEPDVGKLCTACGKSFKTSSKLQVHMRIHTKETPYKCSYCDKRVATRGHLVVHERTHTGERPHVCNYCGKRFNQSSGLSTHMRIHTGRPEVCEICQKRFCRLSELKLHMRKHTGEKPYSCPECGQSFVQRSHVMEHLKSHTENRPYQCTICERSFKQRHALRSHMYIHQGYKPYACNQCSYASRQSYSLTVHMKQHGIYPSNTDKAYVCAICQKGFTTEVVLLSHMNLSHSSDPSVVII